MKQYHPPWRLWITIRLARGASSLFMHSSLLAAPTTFAGLNWRIDDWSIHRISFLSFTEISDKDQG
jgi:hypothetical protein